MDDGGVVVVAIVAARGREVVGADEHFRRGGFEQVVERRLDRRVDAIVLCGCRPAARVQEVVNVQAKQHEADCAAADVEALLAAEQLKPDAMEYCVEMIVEEPG